MQPYIGKIGINYLSVSLNNTNYFFNNSIFEFTDDLRNVMNPLGERFPII